MFLPVPVRWLPIADRVMASVARFYPVLSRALWRPVAGCPSGEETEMRSLDLDKRCNATMPLSTKADGNKVGG